MTTSAKTPYELLGVVQDNNDVQLRVAYRKHIHALKNGSLTSSAFRLICRAYETLSDHDKREVYDARQEWISQLPVEKYTLQQLAAEPDLFAQLKQQLRSTTLKEINAQDPLTGHTPLYCAARVGSTDVVSYLTEQGAEPDRSQRTGSTALHVASFYGHPDVVRTLLESGANYQKTNKYNNKAEDEAFPEDLDVKRAFSELKNQPYIQAATNELVSFSQHVDEQYYAQRQTLLHCASKKGYSDLVCRLVEQHQANVDIVDINENSALHLAAYGGHVAIVEYLLNQGANSLLVNRWGMTAEEEGAIHGNEITDIFQNIRKLDMFEMARNGIDWWFKYHFGAGSPDSVDSRGTSLLYHACRYGPTSVAKWLLEHGANVNLQLAVDPQSTPLHGASFYGHVSTVELLLTHGADVSIKNNYGSTALNETNFEKVKQLLLQYQDNLLDNKIIPVEIFTNGDDSDNAIAKFQLHLGATRGDLLAAIPETLRNGLVNFSIVGRPLYFEKDITSVISAVGCSRYACTKLIEVPLRLTLDGTLSHKSDSRQEPRLDFRVFQTQFRAQSRRSYINLKIPFNDRKVICVDGLNFGFSTDCITKDVSIEVRTLHNPDFKLYGVPGCICLFETAFLEDNNEIRELPVVSLVSRSNARLYTLATPAPFWFTFDTGQTRLPMLNAMHAFVCHTDIIPKSLSLPADMFIESATGQPLLSRQSPANCSCLELRKKNTGTFPYTAYHGTSIEVVRSILMDGLVLPGTVVSNGVRVNPPSNHFARQKEYFGIVDFAKAIFVSPSMYYSSDPVYARPFTHGDQQLVPVLECSVKHNSFSKHAGTVNNYTQHPGDDPNALEWRIQDPTSIEINAVLFIPVVISVTKAREIRAKK